MFSATNKLTVCPHFNSLTFLDKDKYFHKYFVNLNEFEETFIVILNHVGNREGRETMFSANNIFQRIWF